MERALDALGGAVDPWGYPLLFAAVLLEASAFVGLFVPGETALLLAGVLCQRGQLSLTVAVAVVGAVLGDSAGYEIGRHLGHRMRRTRLGRKVGDERWDRAHQSVRRRGGWAVFLGRWVGVLRALVPAVAGDARMDYPTFLAFNVLGAAVQVPVLIVAGYLAGESFQVVGRYLSRGSMVLLAVLVAAAVGAYLWRRRHPPA